jgi:hypothetical protein
MHDAQLELDQYECRVPSLEGPRAAPETETSRLMRNMTPKPERSACRFAVAKTDEGKPVIQLQLFHDTVAHLRSLTVGFDMLGGVTPENARTLVDAMNETIVGIIVTPE